MGQLAELSFTYQNLGLGGAFRSDDSANVGTNYAGFWPLQTPASALHISG